MTSAPRPVRCRALLCAFLALAALGLASLLVAACEPGPAPTGTSPAQPQLLEPPELFPAQRALTATLTILYDNVAHDAALEAAWGFACLIETGDATVLFDTGGDGQVLLANMHKLGVDPQTIRAVALSHAHADHTGGLAALLATGAQPVVHLPASFPAAIKDQVAARTRLVEVKGPAELLPGVYTTGEVGSEIVEQALAVRTAEGLVVVTGCAHPGIVEMVRRARVAAPGEVALVVGGFHLEGATDPQVERIVAGLRGLGVRRLAPTHCTGERARERFAEAWGDGFLPGGIGWRIGIGCLVALPWVVQPA